VNQQHRATFANDFVIDRRALEMTKHENTP
jgi:hypothetical protein